MRTEELIARLEKLEEIKQLLEDIPVRPGVYDPSRLPPFELKELAHLCEEVEGIRGKIEAIKQKALANPAFSWALLCKLEGLLSELETIRLRLMGGRG